MRVSVLGTIQVSAPLGIISTALLMKGTRTKDVGFSDMFPNQQVHEITTVVVGCQGSSFHSRLLFH